MKKIIVLGAGMVGSAMAIDLAKDHDVTSVDKSEYNFSRLEENGVKTMKADISFCENIKPMVEGYDMVIGAVPGFMGYRTCEAVIKSGKDIVDISFFAEDFFGLDELAKQNSVTAVVDCGVAPGMSNLILGYHNKRMEVRNFECYVGGLPMKREKPFEYKAPFSPVDVLEEYIRPARYVENGHIVTKPAISDSEYINFKEVGTLEAFNSDGLRSLIYTMKIPNMKEKTLRYPGHIEYIKVLMDAGFFSSESMKINGAEIRPIDFTSRILFDKWKLGASEEEFTIMKIIVEGAEEGKQAKYVYDLFDKFDSESGTSSMARTTGYTATAAANLLLQGMYDRKGVIPPEYIGENKGCFDFIMEYLKDRGVLYNRADL